MNGFQFELMCSFVPTSAFATCVACGTIFIAQPLTLLVCLELGVLVSSESSILRCSYHFIMKTTFTTIIMQSNLL